MNGHIEYINGFPVWVDGETNWKTSFTSTSTGIAEDLPYYPSTTTTITKYENFKNIKYESFIMICKENNKKR